MAQKLFSTLNFRETTTPNEILVRMDLVVKDAGNLFTDLAGESDSQENTIAEIKTFVKELKTRFQSRIIKQSGQILFCTAWIYNQDFDN